MKLRPIFQRAMVVAGSVVLIPIVQAQSLDIAPGQWKKTLKMEKGGKTLMNQTLDACMTREGLDFQQFRNKFSGNKGICKLAEDEVTGKRLRVTIQCAGSTTRSTRASASASGSSPPTPTPSSIASMPRWRRRSSGRGRCSSVSASR